MCSILTGRRRIKRIICLRLAFVSYCYEKLKLLVQDLENVFIESFYVTKLLVFVVGKVFGASSCFQRLAGNIYNLCELSSY